MLAKPEGQQDALFVIADEERERLRKEVHSNTVNFRDWTEAKGAIPDARALLRSLHWPAINLRSRELSSVHPLHHARQRYPAIHYANVYILLTALTFILRRGFAKGG